MIRIISDVFSMTMLIEERSQKSFQHTKNPQTEHFSVNTSIYDCLICPKTAHRAGKKNQKREVEEEDCIERTSNCMIFRKWMENRSSSFRTFCTRNAL